MNEVGSLVNLVNVGFNSTARVQAGINWAELSRFLFPTKSGDH